MGVYVSAVVAQALVLNRHLAMAHTVLSCTYLTWHQMCDRHLGDSIAATKEWCDLIEQGFFEVHGCTFVLVDRTYITAGTSSANTVEPEVEPESEK